MGLLGVAWVIKGVSLRVWGFLRSQAQIPLPEQKKGTEAWTLHSCLCRCMLKGWGSGTWSRLSKTHGGLHDQNEGEVNLLHCINEAKLALKTEEFLKVFQLSSSLEHIEFRSNHIKNVMKYYSFCKNRVWRRFAFAMFKVVPIYPNLVDNNLKNW